MKRWTVAPWMPAWTLACSTIAMATVPTDAVERAPFVQAIDWQLIVIVGSFGLLGSLPRLDPIATDRRIWQQLAGGLVGGLVGGLTAAESDWFSTAPRWVLVLALVAGYMGTGLLNIASDRLTSYVTKAEDGHASKPPL